MSGFANFPLAKGLSAVAIAGKGSHSTVEWCWQNSRGIMNRIEILQVLAVCSGQTARNTQ